jgi:PPOX class probable F420-dependent enzyme
VDLEQARSFVRTNHRSVIATTRKDGRPALTPVAAVVDDEGRVMVSSRETAYKVHHLRRDPRVTMCVVNDGWFGDWIQIEGTATVISLPDAMELLVDYYRRAAGEHPDWDDYRATMVRDQRVIIRIDIERAGPDRHG